MLVDLQAQEAVDVIHHSCLQKNQTPKVLDIGEAPLTKQEPSSIRTAT